MSIGTFIAVLALRREYRQAGSGIQAQFWAVKAGVDLFGGFVYPVSARLRMEVRMPGGYMGKTLKVDLTTGPVTGTGVPLNDMLDDDYYIRGYDKNGVITQKELNRLGIRA